MFSLENKRAFITGAGSGIGRAIALTFASHGAEVFVCDLNKRAVEEVAELIALAGRKAHAVIADVTDPEIVNDFFSEVYSVGQDIDILVNSAGIAHVGNIENTEYTEFDKVFQVNVKGVFNCIKALIPLMKAKGGVILNLASIAATTGISDRFAYSMSKGAVLSMTLSIAKDYVKNNIRCNCISPARVHTPFVDLFIKKNYPGREKEMFESLSAAQPIGRMGSAEEVALLALYLCSDGASFITGSDYLIDGGFSRLK